MKLFRCEKQAMMHYRLFFLFPLPGRQDADIRWPSIIGEL